MDRINSQQLLAAMYAQSLDGIFFLMLDQSIRWDDSVDKDTVLEYVLMHLRLTYGNPAFYAQHQAKEEDLLGLTPLDFYQDPGEARRNWRVMLEKGHLHIELEIQRMNGLPLWLEGDYTWLKDDAGDYIGCFGIQHDITERKQAERLQRDNEIRYQALFNQSHDAVYVLDLQGRHIAANQRACEMIGYTLEELQTLSYLETTAEPVASGQVLQKLLSGENPPLYKRIFVRKNGEQFPAEVNVELVCDSQGAPLYIQSLVRDISAREAMVTELSHRAVHAEALNRVIDACIESDAVTPLFQLALRELASVFQIDSGRIYTDSSTVTYNAFWQSAPGFQPSTPTGLPAYKLLVVDDWATFATENPKLLESAQRALQVGVHSMLLVEISSNHKPTAVMILLHSQPHHWSPEDVALAQAVGRQLGMAAERLRLKQALQDSEERYRILSGMMADYACVIRIDADQSIHMEWEREGILAQMTGYSYDEFMARGGPLFAVVPEDRHNAKPNWSPHMPVENVEFRLRHKDGRIRWLRRISRGGESQEPGVLGRLYQTLHDITEQKRLEEQERTLEREQERSQILSRFIRDASHEFRTPLSILNLNIYALRRSIQGDRELKRLETMAHQIHVTNGLLDDLLTLSRIDSGVDLDFAPLDINWLLGDISEVHRAQAQQKSLTFNLIRDPSLPRICGNGDYFTIAMRKLLDNAVRYTNEGSITVRTGLEDNYVVVEVQDTGIGMSFETQERSTERFFRFDDAHSEQGFGLGLSIVKGIFELHNGAITVNSEEGKGSTFRVYLPVT